MADIRSGVIEGSRQNPTSRAFYAKNDDRPAGGWTYAESSFVFNVRSVVFLWPVLVVNSQTEHPPNCFWRSRGRHGDIAVGSEVQRDVADTRVMVSDIHRNVVTQSQEGAENQRR